MPPCLASLRWFVKALCELNAVSCSSLHCCTGSPGRNFCDCRRQQGWTVLLVLKSLSELLVVNKAETAYKGCLRTLGPILEDVSSQSSICKRFNNNSHTCLAVIWNERVSAFTKEPRADREDWRVSGPLFSLVWSDSELNWRIPGIILKDPS